MDIVALLHDSRKRSFYCYRKYYNLAQLRYTSSPDDFSFRRRNAMKESYNDCGERRVFGKQLTLVAC